MVKVTVDDAIADIYIRDRKHLIELQLIGNY